MINFQDEEFKDIDLNFQVVFKDRFDELHFYNLRDNGDQIPLNKSNVEEYISLYTDWYLNKSIKNPFESFYKGTNLILKFMS